VEQNLHVVRQLAEGAVVLSGGRVVHTGSALGFLDDAGLTQRLLGVSAEVTSHEAAPHQKGAAL
jgi:branched-chain amino acid transport system ATP-binding protein